MGLPDPSWAGNDIETFPAAEAITCGKVLDELSARAKVIFKTFILRITAGGVACRALPYG
jgi:hypothetical protein